MYIYKDGNVKFELKYQMGDAIGSITSLSKDSQERDLGVISLDGLKFNKQLSESVGKAEKSLELTKWSFSYLNSDLFIKVYKILTKGNLKCICTSCFRYFRKSRSPYHNLSVVKTFQKCNPQDFKFYSQ